MIDAWRNLGAHAARRAPHHSNWRDENRHPMYYRVITLIIILQYVIDHPFSSCGFGLNLQIPNRYHFISF